MTWSIRPLDPVGDRGSLAVLWTRALSPAWPLLPAGLELLRRGYVAHVGNQVVGAVAIDRAIVFIAVDPDHQRGGLGSLLLRHALEDLAAAGVAAVSVGAGGADYIWPGVPTDLPAALGFFSAHGWSWDDTTTDLLLDLQSAPIVELVDRFPAPPDVVLATIEPHEMDEVMAFEEQHFPYWARWFIDSQSVLVARRDDHIRGTLLIRGPGPVHTCWTMLGDNCGTITCVGVDPGYQNLGIASALVARASTELAARGVGPCVIAWSTRDRLYGRLGYRPWREYRLGSRRNS
jgi:ribosomal protein S18 acetylase RimI-like enzyme